MKQKRIKERTPFGPGKISPGCLRENSKHDTLTLTAQTISSSLGQVESFSFLNNKLGAATSGKIQGKCCGDCGVVIVLPDGTKVLMAFDGVGGKPDDFFASRTCAEAAKAFLLANPRATMRDAIIRAEQALMSSEQWKGYPDGKKPGCTTCLVRVTKEGKIEGAYAGDCFAVLVNGKKFTAQKLTSDQRSGDGVGLSCYIGKNAAMCNDIRAATLAPGDIIVVSSDGLENVLVKEIGMSVLPHSDMENAALELLRLSNSRCEFREYDALPGAKVQGKADDRLILAHLQE